MTGKNGPQLVADSRLAHEQGKALLIELQGTDLDEEACEATWQELMHTVEQHVRFCRKFSSEVICGMLSFYDQR